MILPALIPFKIIKTMALKPFSSRSTVVIVIILLCFTQSTVAQRRRLKSESRNSWEFGISGGASKFLNTINPNSDAPFKKFNYWNADFNPAVTLSVIKNFSPKFSAEFEFLTTKFSGAWNQSNSYGIPQYALDKGLENPGPFKMGINQFALMFVPNLNQIISPQNASNRWYLFLKVGFGAAYLKEYYSLFPYGKGAGYKFSLAYGGGLTYTINEKIKMKLGATWYRVESDRLDGIITIKPNHPSTSDEDYYFNIKESYIHPYIGITYGIGQIESKAHFIRSQNGMFRWFRTAKHKYRR